MNPPAGDRRTGHGPSALDVRIRLDGSLRLLVIDGRELVAQGLRTVLGEVLVGHIEVRSCSHEGGWPEVANEVVRHQPDVVALEISEATLIPRLRAHDPGLRILVLTPADDHEVTVDLLRDGADGVVPMTAPASGLALALLTVSTGTTVLPTAAVRSLLARIRPPASARLSDDHVEVWRLIAEGATDRRIANALHVSERTAKRRVAGLLRALDASSRVEAAFLAGWYAVVDGGELGG